jgi:hypothetical protein
MLTQQQTSDNFVAVSPEPSKRRKRKLFKAYTAADQTSSPLIGQESDNHVSSSTLNYKSQAEEYEQKMRFYTILTFALLGASVALAKFKNVQMLLRTLGATPAYSDDTYRTIRKVIALACILL